MKDIIIMIVIMLCIYVSYVTGIRQGKRALYNKMSDELRGFSYWMGNYPVAHNVIYFLGHSLYKYKKFDFGYIMSKTESLQNTRVADLEEEELNDMLK